MFIHLLAGSLVFLLIGKIFNYEINRTYLMLGAFWGIFPDLASCILSRAITFDKWTHTHRDNITHSVFFPGMVLAIAILLDCKMAITAGAAMLTHPFLDLFGIGWGIKMFYPFSKKTYKMFYDGRILAVWHQWEVDTEARNFGDDNWVRNIYLKPTVIGAVEWLSLAGFLLLVALH